MRHLLLGKTLFLSLFISSFFSLAAQAPKTNLKEIAEQLQMTEYAADTAAAAVILSDYGEAYIEELSGELSLKYTRYRRVKILNESAFDLSEVEIPYHKGSGHKVSNIKGITFYLDGNKAKEIKLSKKEIIKEELSDGWEEMKFTLPQVKEGTVFEYSYQIIYEHFSSIRPWYFQKYYPVAHSEYRTRIPDWFSFLPLFKGGMPLTHKESSSYARSVTHRVRSEFLPTESGRTVAHNQTTQYSGEETVYIMDNVPAFVEEPFMTTADDHLASLQFQLQSIQYPGQPIRPILGSWESMAKELMEISTFGDRLNDGRIKKLVRDLPLAGKPQDEQVESIYEYVRSTMNWDGDYDLGADDPLHTAFDQKEGSSAEINLILLTMLREAGIKAYPVIVSTRGHGKVQQIYPLINQFNHVIVLAAMTEGEILLDASSDYTSFGMLPKSALNGQGFLVDEQQTDWVNLAPRHKDDVTIMANLKLAPDGEYSGKFSKSYKGYNGASARSRMTKVEKDEMEYAKAYIMDDWSEAEIEKVEVKHLGERNRAMDVTCEFVASDYINVVGDFIYVQPMLSVAQSENPFKLKERSYPVDFAAPIHEQYILNLVLPEGYVVDEMPEATRIALPNKGGSFSYQVQAMGPIIQLVSDLSITQRVFSVEEYGNIKAFFDYVVAKHAEQIVLKKSE